MLTEESQFQKTKQASIKSNQLNILLKNYFPYNQANHSQNLMPFHYFLLISSNGDKITNESGAIGKSILGLESQTSGMEKATPLKLRLDITNLQDKYSNPDDVYQFCESSKHNNTLKNRSKILELIKMNFSSWGSSFYFTGHGYGDGDLCIETKENPEGQELKIEDILDIMVEAGKGQVSRSAPQFIHPLFFIFIDSCYSGRNAKRAMEHLLKRKFIGDVEILCSSGPQYESYVSQVGSLLIAADCKETNPLIKKKIRKYAEEFEKQKPIKLVYDYNTKSGEATVRSERLKFDCLIG